MTHPRFANGLRPVRVDRHNRKSSKTRTLRKERSVRHPKIQKQHSRRDADATKPTELLIAERDHGIDAHGAARGDITGGERDDDQQRGDTEKRERVVGTDAEKHFGH